MYVCVFVFVSMYIAHVVFLLPCYIDQSSELSVALKRSQMELAAALTERDTLRSHNMAVQVRTCTDTCTYILCMCIL